MIRYQLSRCIAFAWIKADGLHRIRHALPAIMTVVCLALYFFALDFGLDVSARHYARAISSALVTLPGFYIASIAAVSSFSSPSLDKEIEGNGAVVGLLTKGVLVPTKLTYRMYVCYLFSYLACVSLALFVSLSLSPAISDAVSEITTYNKAAVINYVGSVVLLMGFWNLIIVSLHGIYFIAERMHRPYA